MKVPSHVSIGGDGISGSENSKCIGPEAEACPSMFRNSKEASSVLGGKLCKVLW